jgi:hypothetical protein
MSRACTRHRSAAASKPSAARASTCRPPGLWRAQRRRGNSELTVADRECAAAVLPTRSAALHAKGACRYPGSCSQRAPKRCCSRLSLWRRGSGVDLERAHTSKGLPEGPRLPGRRRRDRRPADAHPGLDGRRPHWPQRSVPARSGSKGRRSAPSRLGFSEQLRPRRAGRHHGRSAVNAVDHTLPTTCPAGIGQRKPIQPEDLAAAVAALAGRAEPQGHNPLRHRDNDEGRQRRLHPGITQEVAPNESQRELNSQELVNVQRPVGRGAPVSFGTVAV